MKDNKLRCNKDLLNSLDETKNCLVLSIKPEFAEKILSGEKRYEYRKKLCQKNVNKIYIYATLPVKKIIGEAEVIKKLKMKKHDLWEETYLYSGISKEFFESYFKKQEYACAYQIGIVKKYNAPVSLECVGLKHAPQSFVYCKEMAEFS